MLELKWRQFNAIYCEATVKLVLIKSLVSLDNKNAANVLESNFKSKLNKFITAERHYSLLKAT